MAFVYSCCFWFSLRLGGIMIALFSIVQAVIFMAIFNVFTKQLNENKPNNILIPLTNDIDLIYMEKFIKNYLNEPGTYLHYIIALLCLYILGCILYIYGAFKLINILMAAYIFLEFLRIIITSFFVITGLLILKENTMDLGLLIAMSVIGGFTLLGMIYLWICVTNLPILINEMKQNEQAILIETLKNLLEKNNIPNNFVSKNTQYFTNKQSRRHNVFEIPSKETYGKPPLYYITS